MPARKKTWIDWLQLIAVAAAAPFFVFPSLKQTWVFAVILVFIGARLVMKSSPFERTPIDWGLGILFIQILATCFVVPDIGFSLPKIAGVLFGLLIFYALLSVLNSERLLKGAVIGYLGAGLALAVFGMVGMFWDSEPLFAKIMPELSKSIPKVNWKLPGAESGFNPNPLGGTLLLIAPLAAVLWIYFRKKAVVFLVGGTVFLMMVIVIFFTQSYGVWIALIISLWLVAFGSRWKKWSLLEFALATVLVFFLKVHKMSDLPKMAENNIVRTKIEQRYSYWAAGIKAIARHPLFGVGMNRLRLDPEVGYENSHAHNQLIHTAAELGIPALVAYLAILIGAGWMCREVFRKTNAGWMKAAAQGLIAGQLAFFIFGLGDAIPLGAKPGILFWISLALITSLYNFMIRNDKEEDRSP
jgi:hypothetical protein